MLSTAPVRVLTEQDRPSVLELLDQDPVTNVFVASRVQAAGGLEPWRLGGEMWGHLVDDRLVSLCYAGANLVPVAATPEAVAAFADRARRQGRRCASIVGEQSAVAGMWEVLEPAWGPARDVRACQPLLAIDGDPAVVPDPLVRRVRLDELDLLVPACVAMFTEEIGVSPLAGDGGALYRARVAELIASGRAYARIEDGAVLFKAEVGAASAHACQVQGVWVHPQARGRGLSLGGTAAVVQLARREVAPVVTLYVNDYNTPARRAYDRVGFRQVGTFTSVLF